MKFVVTTWAAFLARQKPVSTRAKPACMKTTRTAPMTIQSRFTCRPSCVTSSVASCADAGAADNNNRAPAATAVPSKARRALTNSLLLPCTLVGATSAAAAATVRARPARLRGRPAA